MATLGGPASSVSVVADGRVRAGGPALPVAVVTDGRAVEGDAADPVYIVTSGPVQAGPALPVIAAAAGARVKAGPAMPVFVVSGSLNTNPNVGGASFALMNTTFTNDLTADGFSWAQSKPIVVDKFNRLIIVDQRNNAADKRNGIVYSNDGGTTWVDSAISSQFLERGTGVYDSLNDLLHVLWKAVAATDGMIYRRYSISRDGSNNITGFTQVAGINLQLDFQNAGTMSYDHPCLLWLNDSGFGANGALLAVWSARNAAGVSNKDEIRASMRVLSNTVADNTAGNWAAPVTADSTSINQSPQVAYSALVVNNNSSIAYPSIGRKTTGANALDTYLCYHDGNNVPTNGNWRWRRMRWNSGSNNWSTGLTTDTLITAMQRAGTDTGYNLKKQLGTFVHEDTANNRMIFGLATWKDNTAGDTWGYVLVNGNDTLSSLVDVYSVGGAHSYAPTGDICYDVTSARIVVSYIKTTTLDAYVRLYSGTAAQQAEVLAFSTQDVDIPLLYPRYNGKLLMAFRQAGTPPQPGWFGTLTWS